MSGVPPPKQPGNSAGPNFSRSTVNARSTHETYHPNGYGVSEGLKRARRPFFARNAITGLAIVGFAGGVYYYSISKVKQDDFSDLETSVFKASKDIQNKASSAQSKISSELSNLKSNIVGTSRDLERRAENPKNEVVNGRGWFSVTGSAPSPLRAATGEVDINGGGVAGAPGATSGLLGAIFGADAVVQGRYSLSHVRGGAFHQIKTVLFGSSDAYNQAQATAGEASDEVKQGWFAARDKAKDAASSAKSSWSSAKSEAEKKAEEAKKFAQSGWFTTKDEANAAADSIKPTFVSASSDMEAKASSFASSAKVNLRAAAEVAQNQMDAQILEARAQYGNLADDAKNVADRAQNMGNRASQSAKEGFVYAGDVAKDGIDKAQTKAQQKL